MIEADDVVAVVVHLWRGRDWDCRVFGKEPQFVTCGRGGTLESRRVVFREPIREELVDGGGLNDVAGHNMGSDFAAFFQENDAKLFIAGFVRQLFETNCCTESGRACVSMSVWRSTQRGVG